LTGLSGVGVTGLIGATGIQGPQGDTGLGGPTGSGVTGPAGSGVTGFPGPTGPQGVTGLSGGGGGSAVQYSSVQRYATDTGSNTETYILSSSEVYTGLSWSRSTTSLTITRNSHGLSSGNRVIIFDTNESYLNTTISSVNTNDFTVTCNATGGTSGSSGAYSVGVTSAQAANKLTISSPTVGNVKIISMRFRGTTTAGGVFDLEISSSTLNNGVGNSTGLSDVNIPTIRVSTNADTLTVVAATIAVNNSSSGYDKYRFGGAGTSLTRLFSLNF
jgi:hypothetical protein